MMRSASIAVVVMLNITTHVQGAYVQKHVSWDISLIADPKDIALVISPNGLQNLASLCQHIIV